MEEKEREKQQGTLSPNVDVSRKNSSGPNHQTDRVTVKITNKKGANSRNFVNLNTKCGKEVE